MTKHTTLRTDRRRGNGERGFALLVVFLLSAGILISLYLEMPRVAFESQRNREEMLLERGEQYSRAIEVFYRKNKRYPGKMEDLENTNNLRFLRRRYKDPLTGKDEWRVVHMGAAGQLADSLVEKPNQQGQQLAGSAQPSATGTPTGPDEVNLAMNRVRPSDRPGGGRGQPGPGTPGYDPNNPNQGQQPAVDANGYPIFDPNQNQNQSQNQFQQGGFNQNVNNNGQNGVNQPGQPNFQQGQNPNFPGQQPSFQAPAGINPYGVQPGTINYQNGQGFSPGTQLQGQLAAQNGLNPGQAGFGQNPALNAINNQLRNQAGFPQPGGGGTGGYNNSGYGAAAGNPASQIPPGAVRLPDGSYKMPDGTTILPDGTVKYPNGIPPPQGLPHPVNPAGLPGQNVPGGIGQTGSGFGTQPGVGTQSGFGNQIQTSAQGGQSFGGAGIAGVASTQVGVGIKRYNDRTKYKEWEFVFDYRKPKTKPTTGVGGLQTDPLGKPLGKPLGTN